MQCHPWVDRDGRLYLHTTDGAPRWRLAVTDPTTPGREHWRELVAEDPDSVLQAVRRLEPAGADAGRRAAGAGPGPARGRRGGPARGGRRRPAGHRAAARPTASLTGLTVADRDTPEQAGRVWLGWTDFITPPQVHRFDLATGAHRAGGDRARRAAPPPPVRSEQRELTSADGTTVRMFVITPDGPDRPRPTLVYGYGGFGISLTPSYSAVRAGLGGGRRQLRGGLAARRRRGGRAVAPGRQPGEQAERLRRPARRGPGAGRRGRHHPGPAGRSWAARTAACWSAPRSPSARRAYRAVVCSAPLLDMVRYEEFSLGRTWNDEYGTAADPEELGWLLSYSPYHHVRPGTEYPAVLFTVFESDTRVDPLHARKMCAALQHATHRRPGHPADPDPPGDRRRARGPVDLPHGRAGHRPAGLPGRAHRAGARPGEPDPSCCPRARPAPTTPAPGAPGSTS